MSIRTWDSGIGGTVAGLLYMLMFVFAILLGIVQGGLRLNAASIIGIWLTLGCLYMDFVFVARDEIKLINRMSRINGIYTNRN